MTGHVLGLAAPDPPPVVNDSALARGFSLRYRPPAGGSVSHLRCLLSLSIGGNFKRYFPNVLGVLADRSVGGKPCHSCYVKHARARPIEGRQPEPFDASLRCTIGIEIRCHHILVGMP